MFNQMKRKMFFRLAAVCMVAVSVLIACTKDYGSDIKALQENVDKLSAQVATLQTAIDNGAVITSVAPITGGTRVTLSDGKTFDVTNGVDGVKGDKGDTGAQGIQGEKGDTGAKGEDGTVWTIGTNGNWYCNGEDSGMPSRGVQGVQGLQGNTGASAYDVAKANGFEGTEAEWLASLKGEKGDTGAQGIQGEKGDTGAQGIQGEKGDKGDQGIQGEKGDKGDQGIQGEKGDKGDQGIQGEKGDKGTNGDYYYPCTDKTNANYGKWIKVNGETAAETVTDQEWLPKGTITAVWDWESETISFHNVEDADGGVISIKLSTELKSLALIPELWDATLGMPTATVYAFLPSAWEIANVFTGRDGNNKFRPGDILWPNYIATYHTSKQPEDFALYYWYILWNTYCGKHGITGRGYNEQYDMTSSNFVYQWVINSMMEDFPDNEAYEFTYDTFVDHIDSELAIWKEAIAAACKYDVYFTRQFPVSALNLKYRVNPAGANLDGYNFSMIDRSLKVATKADGDNRNYAVAKVEAEQSSEDQINVSGYINYFKYWSEQPIEWLLGLMATKELYSWDYYCKYDGKTDDASQATKFKESFGTLVSRLFTNDRYTGTILSSAITSYSNWMDAMGLSYETIVALEAAKDADGTEAIVSDYASVKMEYVSPIWTAYNHHDASRSREHWMVVPNYFNNYKKTDYGYYENDYIEMGKTYDVASHMRFADPYYGTIDKLGFSVKYDYYVFCAANNQNFTRYDATGFADRDNNPSGETEWNFGAWDKVNVDENGLVSFKEGATDAIGKYVMITADASIYNEATGTWYNSAVGAADPWGGNKMHDTFAGHYILLVIPNADETIKVDYDLGSFDYLALTKTSTAPASKVLDTLDMDLEGFNNIYQAPEPLEYPNGYSSEYNANSADMFSITLDNSIELGEGSVTYTIKPKIEYEDQYPIICYTIKYNITIDWRATEPILNPDYILYDEDGALTKTIINPDPVTVTPYSQDNYPYVDSIVAVKGKAVDGTWTPQSSIREHILDYGTYMESQPNIYNLNMSINYSASKQDASTAEIFSTASSTGDVPYTAQEIKMLTPYKDHEQYRDYVVDMNITLANGTNKVVKGYIVRFVCPMYIVIEDDITLETHKTNWCSDTVYFKVLEVGSNVELATFVDQDTSKKVLRVNEYAQQTYAGIFSDMEAPVWKLNTDKSFGGNLLCENNTGWFFWNNNGTDLQVDKHATYDVTLNLPQLAKLAATGNIEVLRTADSHSAHNMEPGEPAEKVPGEGALPTYEIVLE